MDVVRDWIVTILSVIIFITFIEILIPNSSHKRYINVIVGLLIMIVILRPLNHILNGKINIEGGIIKASNELDYRTVKNRVNSFELNQNEAILQIYKRDVIKQIKQRIEMTTNYEVKDIFVYIEKEDRDRFGVINGLEIILTELEQEKAIWTKTEIKPVKINIKVGNNDQNTVFANNTYGSDKESILKNDFSNFYNIPKENISIYILKNN